MIDFATLPTQTIDIHGVRWEASVIVPRRSYALFNPATGEGKAFSSARALQLHIGDLKAHPEPKESPLQLAAWSVTTSEAERARVEKARGHHLPSGPVIVLYPNPDRYLQYVGEFLTAVTRYFDAVRDLMNARTAGLMNEATWARKCALSDVGRAALDVVNSQTFVGSYAPAGD